ncbi:MAG: bifunctional phosphopantothenoylcysteine decarboxylase/phosphopantothenate--cysteine ligase CoaBC [Crenarchaeota archaeon]|nr:bifunctional phosphopantothenoylcysteine decarboxylase/phosphopantothenate--cysteine ligase CoaBC [Thermoproteota archaeon]
MERVSRKYIFSGLKDKKILLGLTASSAIYRSIDLARELIRHGAKVVFLATEETKKFIGETLLEWAVGEKPVYEATGKTEHIGLAEWADAMIVAPATLATMSRIAYGITDDIISLTAASMLGSGKKVIVVPTMNIRLYNSPQLKRTVEMLESIGVYVVPPYISEGKVKFPPLDDLVHLIDALVNRGRDMQGLEVLVTGGATREYIDPVRVITNPSSGLMGILLAREIGARGASVDLVLGVASYQPPYYVSLHKCETTIEMINIVKKLSLKKTYDAAVFAAAPSDFKPLMKNKEKIDTHGISVLSIRIKVNPKVINAVPRTRRPRLKIIFAAETVSDEASLIERALRKLEYYDADMVVANIVGKGLPGFSSELITACIVTRNEHVCLGTIGKNILARRIADEISKLARSEASTKS